MDEAGYAVMFSTKQPEAASVHSCCAEPILNPFSSSPTQLQANPFNSHTRPTDNPLLSPAKLFAVVSPSKIEANPFKSPSRPSENHLRSATKLFAAKTVDSPTNPVANRFNSPTKRIVNPLNSPTKCIANTVVSPTESVVANPFQSPIIKLQTNPFNSHTQLSNNPLENPSKPRPSRLVENPFDSPAKHLVCSNNSPTKPPANPFNLLPYEQIGRNPFNNNPTTKPLANSLNNPPEPLTNIWNKHTQPTTNHLIEPTKQRLIQVSNPITSCTAHAKAVTNQITSIRRQVTNRVNILNFGRVDDLLVASFLIGSLYLLGKFFLYLGKRKKEEEAPPVDSPSSKLTFNPTTAYPFRSSTQALVRPSIFNEKVANPDNIHSNPLTYHLTNPSKQPTNPFKTRIEPLYSINSLPTKPQISLVNNSSSKQRLYPFSSSERPLTHPTDSPTKPLVKPACSPTKPPDRTNNSPTKPLLIPVNNSSTKPLIAGHTKPLNCLDSPTIQLINLLNETKTFGSPVDRVASQS